MDPQSTTAAVSAASKSTWRTGLKAESQVLKFLESRGCTLAESRWASGFAEVDLLLRTRAGVLLLVEVKSLAHGQDPVNRISRLQIQRLKRAVQFLSGYEECLAYVFFVRPAHQQSPGEIFWLPLSEF